MGHIEGLGNDSHNIGGIVGLAKEKNYLQGVQNSLTIIVDTMLVALYEVKKILLIKLKIMEM